MKLKFQPDLKYQRDAINAVLGLFKGQPLERGEFEIGAVFPGQAEFFPTELAAMGYGNRLSIPLETVRQNLFDVQVAFGIKKEGEAADDVKVTPSLLGEHDARVGVPHFTVEMETGTGKTYVYLRSIFELNRDYGFTKFVIVVPSVAIREGVLANIKATREHFAALYDNVPFNAWVYDSRRVSSLRQFASSNQIQVLIINIDAFNKASNNIIHNEQDRLSGNKPIEFIQSTMPIVIVDEPQNMESETAASAITSLNPLCTLRYSATHRNLYNLVYRLGPVEAYDMGLVKQIEVDSVLDDENFNRPFVEVTKIAVRSSGPIAQIRLDVELQGGPKKKTITLKKPGEDLKALSNGREIYEGWVVAEINAGHSYVEFGNGQRLYQGESSGARTDEIMETQIRQTIREHFDKEQGIARLPEEQRMKVLSLFFIDRVANYADSDGKIRLWFEKAYKEISEMPVYAALNPSDVNAVHNGYFAQDKNGRAKDTKGKSKADDETYHLIMRDKERLLSPEEPLRFIFSHSALREGWDNPNVFQICTLNETRSEIKKRQEIGRGLRLPVLVTGDRCHDPHINRLTVVANEHYDDFAAKLQQELRDDAGIEFGDRIKNKRKRRKVTRKPLNEDFRELWQRIRKKTRYAVRFDTAKLIDRAADAIRKMPAVHVPKIIVRQAQINVDAEGVEATVTGIREAPNEYTPENIYVPDLIGHLQRETGLTRTTLAAILVASESLNDVSKNPQVFLSQTTTAIQTELNRLMIEGIQYELLHGENARHDEAEFAEEFESYEQSLIDVDNSIYDAIEFDSQVEMKFAHDLDKRNDIRLFVKLPDWFKVPTPIGKYNPDWAIVLKNDETVYLVRETKGSLNTAKLRPDEQDRIECGKVHFEHLGVDFKVVTSAAEVYAQVAI